MKRELYLTQHTDEFYNIILESKMNNQYYIIVLGFTK